MEPSTSSSLMPLLHAKDLPGFSACVKSWPADQKDELIEAVAFAVNLTDDSWIHALMQQPSSHTPILMTALHRRDWPRIERLAEYLCAPTENVDLAQDGAWAIQATRDVVGSGDLVRLMDVLPQANTLWHCAYLLPLAAWRNARADAVWLCHRLSSYWNTYHGRKMWHAAIHEALSLENLKSIDPASVAANLNVKIPLKQAKPAPVEPNDGHSVLHLLLHCPVKPNPYTIYQVAKMRRPDLLDVLLARADSLKKLIGWGVRRFKNSAANEFVQWAPALDTLVSRLPLKDQVPWVKICPEALPEAVSRVRESDLSLTAHQASPRRVRPRS